MKMLNNAKKLEAEILSELSSLTAKMRLTADIISKEQEEELFPLLSDILKKIQSHNSASSQCYKLAGAANKRAEDTIKHRVGAVESRVLGKGMVEVVGPVDFISLDVDRGRGAPVHHHHSAHVHSCTQARGRGRRHEVVDVYG